MYKNTAESDVNYSGRASIKFLVMFLVSSMIAIVWYYLTDTPDWKIILSAYFYTIIFWEGNYRFSVFAYNKYPGISETKVRLLISLLFVFVYTLLIVVIWEGLIFQFSGWPQKFI